MVYIRKLFNMLKNRKRMALRLGGITVLHSAAFLGIPVIFKGS